MPAEQLFISDLHLDPSRPEVIKLFLAFLQGRASQAEALYILGDLFEYWIGDDDTRDGLQPVLTGLRALSASGVPVYVMTGNRDFLMGDEFARKTGCTLLGDAHRIDLLGEPTVLMHGDTLCTDDLPYQQLRGMLRNPDWQDQFLSLPLGERRKQAENLRSESRQATSEKTETIMDVNPDTVAACFKDHDVSLLIHGHTHRPARHTLDVDGRTRTRWVLGDWYTQGSVLSASTAGLTLETLKL